jgi:hypothetical protein
MVHTEVSNQTTPKGKEEMEMLEKLDYDKEHEKACLAPEWNGSLYKDTDTGQYVIIVPFPNFICCGRNESLYQAMLDVNRSVEYAQEGRYQIAKRKREEEDSNVPN